MQTTIKDIIMEFLMIAGYPNDKEKFVEEFERLNLLEAMVKVFDKLPKESQYFIRAHQDEPELIQQHIPQELYILELKKVTREALKNLITDISPLLSEHQKEKISTIPVDL